MPRPRTMSIYRQTLLLRCVAFFLGFRFSILIYILQNRETSSDPVSLYDPLGPLDPGLLLAGSDIIPVLDEDCTCHVPMTSMFALTDLLAAQTTCAHPAGLLPVVHSFSGCPLSPVSTQESSDGNSEIFAFWSVLKTFFAKRPILKRLLKIDHF